MLVLLYIRGTNSTNIPPNMIINRIYEHESLLLLYLLSFLVGLKTYQHPCTRRRKLPGFFEPHSLGVNLRSSMSVKYLGVVLECRLTWREHVDVKVRKAHNLLWACRWACDAMWGLRPKVVHWLYVSVIRPSITFASLV
jgi:hypothetical protein